MKTKFKYKTGEVILCKTDHPSFSWNNGLFIFLEFKNDALFLCKLDDEGNPQKFEDGRYMTFCTGLNNKSLYKTNLFYKLEPNYKQIT